MGRRKTILSSIRQAVLLEAGYKCANPTCRHILTLELHHIVWVKDNGGNEQENLLALCPNCHSLHTKGHIPSDAILTWKSLLVAINNPNRAMVDLLLVLYEEEKRISEAEDPEKVSPPFRFSGDGLTTLSGLITSGLLVISRRFSGVQIYGGGGPSFEVSLTEDGKRLVEAWLSGKPDEIEKALKKQ